MGLDPRGVWEYTPIELNKLIEGYTESRIRKLEDTITLAWYTEVFSRTEKLEDLPSLLSKLRPEPIKDSSSDEEIIEIAKRKGIKIRGINYG